MDNINDFKTDDIPILTDGARLHELWETAPCVRGRNPNLWRKDKEGNMMYRHSYMNPASAYGWKVKLTLRTDGNIELYPIHYKEQ